MNREELLKQAKPILFNTEMVKAILEGRKTVTRRVVKPQPDEKHNFPLGFVSDSTDKKVIGMFRFGIDEYGGSIQHAKPPFKQGDYLYVRETFSPVYIKPRRYLYKVGCEEANNLQIKWRPSIHMPKEAARIFLTVTNVRVERLQDITEEQALAEGVPEDWPMNEVYCPRCKGEGLIGALSSDLGFMEVDCHHCDTATKRFSNLWNSTIKKADLDKYGWNANPWVWTISFERVEV